MRLRSLPVVALVAVAAAGISACSSTTSGAGHTDAPAATSTPTDARSLADLMQSAEAGVKSAHIRLNVALMGHAINGSGVEQLSNGKLTAMDITETVPPAGDLRLIIADGKTYAKLPSSINPTSKPYVLVTTSSSNPVIQRMASSIDSSLSSASIGNVNTFARAAKSVHVAGHDTVNGVPATQYNIVVDLAKLPANMSAAAALKQSGLKTLPVQLWIDSQGRPVQLIERVTVQGEHVVTKVGIDKYNAPVTIKAPPANQVATH